MSAHIDGDALPAGPTNVHVALCNDLHPAMAAHDALVPEALKHSFESILQIANGDVGFACALATIVGEMLHIEFHRKHGAKTHEQ